MYTRPICVYFTHTHAHLSTWAVSTNSGNILVNLCDFPVPHTNLFYARAEINR